MDTAKTIVIELGRDRIQQDLGVKPSAVAMAIHNDRFPAAWFDVLEELARDKGRSLPRALFNWKRAQSSSDERGLSHVSCD